MITEQEYLKAVETINKYKKENRKKKTSKSFTLEDKKILTDIVFLKNKEYGYSKLIDKIGSVFKLGISNSKKMLLELQSDGIINKNGSRGAYAPSPNSNN